MASKKDGPKPLQAPVVVAKYVNPNGNDWRSTPYVPPRDNSRIPTSLPQRLAPLKVANSAKVVVGVDLLVRMRACPGVNWSEVCRRAIRAALEELEGAAKKKLVSSKRSAKDAAKRKRLGRPPAGAKEVELHRKRHARIMAVIRAKIAADKEGRVLKLSVQDRRDLMESRPDLLGRSK